jgi:hypothetical protein
VHVHVVGLDVHLNSLLWVNIVNATASSALHSVAPFDSGANGCHHVRFVSAYLDIGILIRLFVCKKRLKVLDGKVCHDRPLFVGAGVIEVAVAATAVALDKKVFPDRGKTDNAIASAGCVPPVGLAARVDRKDHRLDRLIR